MCKCHFLNKTTGKQERVNGIFSLATANIGDSFRFNHESFDRKVIDINFKLRELFAPPIGNYSGMDERGSHVFHFSFNAKFGNDQFIHE